YFHVTGVQTCALPILKHQAEALSGHLQAPLPVDNTPFSLRITLVTMSLPDDATDPNQFRRRLNLTFEKASDSGTAVTRYQPGEEIGRATCRGRGESWE